MGQWVRAQGQVKVAKNLKTWKHALWRHLQKTPNGKQKTCFSISTRRLAESVDGLDSSLAQLSSDFWPKKGRPMVAVKGLNLEVQTQNKTKLQA